MMIMTNKKILIVGLGLMGGSYAHALSKKGYYVGAVTKEQSSIDYALEHGIIKSGSTIPTKEYVEQFDVKYNCGCNKEKFISGLATLEESELLDMIEKDKGAELECQICGKKYQLTEEDLLESIRIKKTK